MIQKRGFYINCMNLIFISKWEVEWQIEKKKKEKGKGDSFLNLKMETSEISVLFRDVTLLLRYPILLFESAYV